MLREPVPFGYAIRYAMSWHKGGWMPCHGPSRCPDCMRAARQREAAGKCGSPGAVNGSGVPLEDFLDHEVTEPQKITGEPRNARSEK